MAGQKSGWRRGRAMSSTAPWLSDDEVADATRRKYPAHQARVLDGWKVPYKRRPDGTLQVGRTAMDVAMGGSTMRAQPASNGPRWSKPA